MNFDLLISIYKKNNLLQIKQLFRSIEIQNKKPKKIYIIFDGFVDSRIYNYLKIKSNIKIIFNKKNIGLGKSLNKGLIFCKSNFVVRCDADDINLPYRFSKLISKLLLYDIVGSEVIETINGKKFKKKVPFIDKKIKKTLSFRNCINHPSVGFRRDAILKIGNYEDVLFFEDYFLWLKAKKNNLKFYNIQYPGVKTFVDSKFYERRSGFKYFKYYINFLMKVHKKNLASPLELLLNFVCHLPILLNSKYIKFIYLNILRKKAYEN